MEQSRVLALGLALAVSLPAAAAARRPSFDEEFDSPDRAFAVEDPEISIVVYKEVTCDSSALWLSFEADSPAATRRRRAGALAWLDACARLGVPIVGVTHHEYIEVEPTAAGARNSGAILRNSV